MMRPASLALLAIAMGLPVRESHRHCREPEKAISRKERERRKKRADLVPASEPALKAMERIGRETRAVIEKRRIVKRTPDTRKVREE